MSFKQELPPSRYLLWAAAACLSFLVFVGSALVYADKQGRLAPPPLTGNMCLDEKARLVRALASEGCDVLVAGSSMALNNIASEPLVQQLPRGARLLNIGAWGMKISETREWIEHVRAITKPTYIVLVVGPMDFYSGYANSQNTFQEDVRGFLRGAPYALYIARHFDIVYYLSSYFSIDRARRNRDHYQSLAFDAWGGLPLNVHYPAVDPVRWNQKVVPELFNDAQYNELRLLASTLRKAGVTLYCVQPPLRKSSIAPGTRPEVESHWNRIARILAEEGQQFLNLHNELELDDAFYADYSHLNARGATIFTNAFAQKVRFEQARIFAPTIDSSHITRATSRRAGALLP
jgi:hypothetical protein